MLTTPAGPIVPRAGFRSAAAPRSAGNLLPLFFFNGRFGHQLEFTQRTHKFGVRFFGRAAHGVDGRVVAVLGPRDGLGDVGVSVALGPFGVDVQFHLQNHLLLYACYITWSVTINPAQAAESSTKKPSGSIGNFTFVTLEGYRA